MLSKALHFFLLLLLVPVQASLHDPQQCNTIRTIVRTVTVTATATPAATTPIRGVAPSKSAISGGNNGGNRGGKPKPGGNNGGNTVTRASTSTPAASTTIRGATPSKSANAGGNTGGNTGNKQGGNGGGKTGGKGAGNTGGNTGGGNDPQSSTTLDPRVIASGFANNGQDVPAAGQVPSLTSTNNFINFCLTVPNLPITNGKQITSGSCNPAPIGVIPSTDNMPSSKFTFPTNFGTIKADASFTIEMAIQNMETGHFVNAQANYFSAPQQLNSQGQIQGHSHVVIEQLSSLDQTTPTDPKKFAFFKGLNAAAAGGKLTADVTSGLAVGFYKLSSINTAANHQPVIVPVAQHGSLDDAIYFTVTSDGKASGAGNNPTTGKPSKGGVNAPSASASVTSSSADATPTVSASDSKNRGTAPTASASPPPDAGRGNKGGSRGGNQGSPRASSSSTSGSSTSAPAAPTPPAGRGRPKGRRFLNRQA